MVHADEISTKELVVTAAESVAGFLGLEQRETAMSGETSSKVTPIRPKSAGS